MITKHNVEIAEGKVKLGDVEVTDAEIFGKGERDTQAVLIADERQVIAIPDKNPDLTELLQICSKLAESCAALANTKIITKVDGDVVITTGSFSTIEATTINQLKAQLDEFTLS